MNHDRYYKPWLRSRLVKMLAVTLLAELAETWLWARS